MRTIYIIIGAVVFAICIMIGWYQWQKPSETERIVDKVVGYNCQTKAQKDAADDYTANCFIGLSLNEGQLPEKILGCRKKAEQLYCTPKTIEIVQHYRFGKWVDGDEIK